MLRVQVDFNSRLKDGRVIINTHYHKDLLPNLKQGLKVILYEPDDIEVEAVLGLEIDNDGIHWWYGVADWDTLKDI